MARRAQVKVIISPEQAARDDYLAAQKTYHALNDRSHDDPDLVQARKTMNLAYDRYVEVCHPRRMR